MNLRRPIQIGLLAAATLVGSMALAQQGQPQSQTDHSAHHGGADQQAVPQAPGGGMKGKDGMMMGQGGMMGGQGGMMGGQGGMMGGQGGMMGGQGGGMMMGQDMMDCPMMGGMMGGPGGGMMGKGQGKMHSRPMMEARLAYIKADLEITAAQEEAWTAYADAVRQRHTAMESVHAGMMKAKESGNASERMDARIKVAEAQLESLKALKPATEALYAVLTDAQKEKADKLLGSGRGMM